MCVREGGASQDAGCPPIYWQGINDDSATGVRPPPRARDGPPRGFPQRRGGRQSHERGDFAGRVPSNQNAAGDRQRGVSSLSTTGSGTHGLCQPGPALPTGRTRKRAGTTIETIPRSAVRSPMKAVCRTDARNEHRLVRACRRVGSRLAELRWARKWGGPKPVNWLIDGSNLARGA
jgi:hypothetical protein